MKITTQNGLRGIALLSALMMATPAGASSAPAGHISVIQVMSNGVVLFNHDGARDALPGCATNLGRWAFDGATPAGQAKLAVLMSAYMGNKQIAIEGAGACNELSSIESINYFYLVN